MRVLSITLSLFMCVSLSAQAQQESISSKDRAANEKKVREEIWEKNARYKYRTRAIFASAVDQVKGKVPSDLGQRIELAKKINEGIISGAFKSRIDYTNQAMEEVKLTLGPKEINAVVNVETQQPQGFFKALSSPTIVEVKERVTLSVVPYILFGYNKYQQSPYLLHRSSSAQWAEPTDHGVRLCRVRGTSGYMSCFEVLPNSSVKHWEGKIIANETPKLELSTSQPQTGDQILAQRELTVGPGLNPQDTLKRVNILKETLESMKKISALTPIEQGELVDLTKKSGAAK